ncbi:GNAT family acetyltransferase [Corynebacterium halotolerans YIM 70093 = DSM 44683]|uniref:GNAT family acetyltransferase n=2 Tax=Corynebacterium halotolerans TaxID=225326 RepID=M1NKG9_9CORY|nr:GNAT family acetyltransferase [Corynebacterium halotolerans YIM 70093 = DSM 44683]
MTSRAVGTTLVRMRIRPAEDKDIPAITALHNWAIRETVALFHDDPVDEADRRQWLDDRRRRGFPVLVADDGEFCGWASYGPFRPSPGYRHTVENSVYVHPDAHGKGVGSKLMTALIDAARADDSVHAVIATIEGDNIGSLRLHEKLGFREVGRLPEVGRKFDRWLDLAYLELIVD